MFEELDPPYGAIVADPPWTYRTTAGIITKARQGACAADMYSGMTNAELAAMPVEPLADENAHLYLWVTNPMLYPKAGEPSPADIVEAWGFRYVTCITWVKQGTLGMGFYWRGDTEHVLFGVRGKAPIPPEKRLRNVFEAPKRQHSAKPPAFLDMVEKVSPAPWVELFCRQPRFGWDSWGYGHENVLEAS